MGCDFIGTLTSMKNIGKEMERKLKSIDINSAEELTDIGAKEAFIRLKNEYSNLCLVHLYTLQGAIDNVKYYYLSSDIKCNLKNFNDGLKQKNSN